MNSEDLMRLGPAAQKQVMEKMRKHIKDMLKDECGVVFGD